jgi:hypothetical protein
MAQSEVDRFAEYHKFVGLFVNEFAQLEYVLRMIIRLHSGLTQDLYDALVGFPRSGEARGLAKKLADLYDLPPEKRSAVNRAFDHLTEIVQLRDRLVHYGGHPINDANEVALFAKSPIGSLGPATFTTQDNLWAAVNDLHHIKLVIVDHLIPGVPSIISDDALHAPWQYKPLPQLNTRQQRDDRGGQ